MKYFQTIKQKPSQEMLKPTPALCLRNLKLFLKTQKAVAVKPEAATEATHAVSMNQKWSRTSRR